MKPQNILGLTNSDGKKSGLGTVEKKSGLEPMEKIEALELQEKIKNYSGPVKA